jgi:hypothetical protein
VYPQQKTSQSHVRKCPTGRQFSGWYHQQTSHFWDRKWGITTDGTHFLHAFPAKWGPDFGWYFYEAACLNGNETALRSTELAFL